MRSTRVPQALTCGLAALLVVGCTGDPEPPEPGPEEEAAPVPTEFEGDLPPGIEGDALRYLHGDDAEVHEILDDPLGVRISPVGGSFLISSGGEDSHLLHDAATGEALWEGEARFRGFDVDSEGESVLLLADGEDNPFVLDSEGELLWEPAEPGDAYLDGVAVRRPAEWSAEEPDGEYAVLDTDGEELWSYTFESEPEDTDEDDEAADDEDTDDETGEGSADEGAEDEEGDDRSERFGVPVAVWGDTLLLDPGDSTLHAHSLDPDSAGEYLWSVTVDDEELGLPATAPVPVPQVLGIFGTPVPEEDDAEDGDEEGDNGTADDEGTEEDEDAEDAQGAEDREGDSEVVLLRWAQPEATSFLSGHDAVDGELLWTLEESGTNPVSPYFDEAGVPGSLYDSETGTLLLPQASGEATMAAVDLVEGEVRWGLEDEDDSLSPAFAHGGLVYGDARSNEDEDEDEQLVLDAETMDVVGDDLSAYVEAITDTGHAILVQDRQRFVIGPEPGTDTEDDPADGSEDEDGDGSEDEPTEDAS
ncbi:outer membrane protein assembly factor BamB family protein [Nocardiopsis oceani]